MFATSVTWIIEYSSSYLIDVFFRFLVESMTNLGMIPPTGRLSRRTM